MEDLKAIYEKLKAPFPTEALSSDVSRGFTLTSVKAQYIVERLNDALGLGSWKLEGNYEKIGNGVMFHGKLTVEICGKTIQVENSGYAEPKENKKSNAGDVYKSARTDCLSKCASWLGVANEVYKGNVQAPSKQKNNSYKKNNNNYDKNSNNNTNKNSNNSNNSNKNTNNIPYAEQLNKEMHKQIFTYRQNFPKEQHPQVLVSLCKEMGLSDIGEFAKRDADQKKQFIDFVRSKITQLKQLKNM
jgi:hypothetical protein